MELSRLDFSLALRPNSRVRSGPSLRGPKLGLGRLPQAKCDVCDSCEPPNFQGFRKWGPATFQPFRKFVLAPSRILLARTIRATTVPSHVPSIPSVHFKQQWR